MANQFDRKLRQWIDLLDHDPIEAIGVCKKDFEHSARSENERKYVAIALMSEFLVVLRKSENDVKRFAALSFWPTTGYQLKKDNLHTYVARYMLEAKETRGALYQQALDWSKVVKHCADEDFVPDDVPDYLAARGIYKLIDAIDAGEFSAVVKAVTAKPKAVTPEADDSRHGEAQSPEDDDDEADGHLSDDDDRVSRKAHNDHQQDAGGGRGGQNMLQEETKPREPRRRSINLDKEVAFEAGVHIERILSTEEGDTMHLTLERIAGRKNWKRFRAIKVEVVRKSRAIH